MSSLGDRMKAYENTYRYRLLPRMPVIIRVDGKAFHSVTRNCVEPFDIHLVSAVDQAALALMEEVQNARCAYVQSDEISLLLVDYNKFASQQWFDGNLQKIVSVSAAIASVAFSDFFDVTAVFDGRAFVLPEREVVNYFVWRQQDAVRNSIQMVAQSLYSHKQLHRKNCDELQDMIVAAGKNWNDESDYFKRGRMVTRNGIENVPIFTQERSYFDRFLEVEEQ